VRLEAEVVFLRFRHICRCDGHLSHRDFNVWFLPDGATNYFFSIVSITSAKIYTAATAMLKISQLLPGTVAAAKLS